MTARPARSIALSGFMATGKSTVGRLVAAELALPFVDTDALIAEQAGKTVGEVFAGEGEAKFRDREAAIILPLLEDGVTRVLSLGGGSVTIPRVRRALLEAATVITLTASAETIAARTTSIAARPNLGAESPALRARDLLALRREAYAECHGAIPTDERDVDEVAARVIELAQRDAIAVPLGLRSYTVELTDGEPSVLTRALREIAPSGLVSVTDANVARLRGGWLDAALGPLRLGDTRVVLSPGEENKNLSTVARIWDAALAGGVDRECVVLAFGGGVVGDLAGFSASTLLRGLRCVQIPTTLLAMVDASVGGKTGFDHPAGKNLLGTFSQPARVIVDLEHLTTLPDRERAAGLAEVVKIALVRDPALLALLTAEAPAVEAGDRAVLREVIRAAIVAKARVVRDDETEGGVRALLNLGHTIGHALEAHGGYRRWLHGEAVAIGIVVEALATERLGLTEPGTSAQAAELLARFGLPTTVPEGDLVAAFPFVMTDKKRTLSAVKLPIVTAPGEGRVERVEIAALRRALGCERRP